MLSKVGKDTVRLFFLSLSEKDWLMTKQEYLYLLLN